MVPFMEGNWDGALLRPAPTASSPASAPARPIPTTSRRRSSSSRSIDGVDMVTVVTEGIFSYCGVKVKIDTDRYVGPEQAAVRVEGRAGRPCHDRRVRLADAVARRRPPPHGRQQEGRRGHLRHHADALQQAARSRCTVDGGATLIGAGRPRAGRQRRGRGAHAGRLRLGHDRHLRPAMARPCRRGDRRRRPHHRRADRASGRARSSTCGPPASACAAANRRPAATSRWPIPAPAGAAPISPIR